MRIIIKLGVLLLLVLHTFLIKAQTTDVIYLKNGSIIKGKLIEQTDKSYKIETCCENVFVFDESEVDRQEVLDEPLPGYIKNRGYFNYTSMGLLVGSEMDDKRSIFSVIMEHHYQVNPYFSFGGIIGVEFFNESVAPLGGVIRCKLPSKRKGSLFVSLAGGHLTSLEDARSTDYDEITDAKGGPFFNSELGVIIPSQSGVNMFVALGYRYNVLNYIRNDWYYGDVERKITYNRISLKLGVMLH